MAEANPLRAELAAYRQQKPQQAPAANPLREELQRAKRRDPDVPMPDEFADAPEAEARYEHPLGDFGLGMGLSAMETYIGLKDLFTDVPEYERKALEMWREDAEKAGGAATAGKLGGELLQLAVPMSKAAKLGKMGVPAGVGVAAAHGGLKAPEEGQTRVSAAAQSGAAALAGAGAGKVLEKTVKGIAKTPAAQRMIERGVRLTPGQASEGALPRVLEHTLSFLPFTARGVEGLRNRSMQDWNAKVLSRVAPPGRTITESGEEGFKQLGKAFNDAYDEAWGMAGRPSNQGLVNIVNQIADEAKTLGEAAHPALKRVMGRLRDMSSDFSQEKLRNLDRLMRKEIDTAYKGKTPNAELGEAIQGLRATLRDSIEPRARDALRGIDSKYGQLLTAERAGAAASRQGQEVFTPSQVLTAAKTIGGNRRMARGEAPLQQTGLVGKDVLETNLPTPLMTIRHAIAKGTPTSMGAADLGRRAALGITTPQMYAQQGSAAISEALRRMGLPYTATGTGATLGAATED